MKHNLTDVFHRSVETIKIALVCVFKFYIFKVNIKDKKRLRPNLTFESFPYNWHWDAIDNSFPVTTDSEAQLTILYQWQLKWDAIDNSFPVTTGTETQFTILFQWQLSWDAIDNSFPVTTIMRRYWQFFSSAKWNWDAIDNSFFSNNWQNETQQWHFFQWQLTLRRMPSQWMGTITDELNLPTI